MDATITYGTGPGQAAFPLFADIPALLAAARELGAADVRATLDGLATATLNGQLLKIRPGFEVTSVPAGTKRSLVEPDGSRAFDFGDGRRQRFTVVP